MNPRELISQVITRARKHTALLHLALIALLCWACYANTLSSSFQLDDFKNIVQNTFIKDLSYFTNPASAQGLLHWQYLERRYVGYLSFALNYRVNGLDVRGYHVVNITIHMLCAMALYGLTLTLLRSRAAALVAAALFAAHPVQTQAVTYIVQRFASLAALFVIASMLAYALARRAQTLKVGWYIASVACAILAVKTKENAAVLPALILLMEWAFFEGASWRRRLLLSAPFWAAALLVPLALYMSQGMELALRERTTTSRLAYFLTQLRVGVTYLRLIFLPVGQSVEYDFPRSAGLGSRELMAGLLHLSVIASGIYMLARRRGVWLLPGFGICLYYIAHAPESSIIPIRDVIFEHRLYLPMAGACMALGAGAACAMQGRARGIVIAICAIIILALAVMTHERNRVWATELTLWQDTASKAPQSARAAHDLGYALWQEGRLEEAEVQLNRALAIDPGYYLAMDTLGIVLVEQGRVSQAEKIFKRAIAIAPGDMDARNNLASVYCLNKQYDRAALLLKETLSLAPGNSASHYTLGVALEGMGKLGEALESYKQAVALYPSYKMAHERLASVYAALGDEQAASYHRALAQGAR